jgi:hypothetical protein
MQTGPAGTRSVGEWGSVATSPEIIHGTTPARDLFSFVAACGRDYQPREARGAGFQQLFLRASVWLGGHRLWENCG